MHALHPELDPRLKERHGWYTKNPANDPEFIFRLMDRMDEDPGVQQAVHDSFFDGDLSFLFHDGQRQINDVLAKEAREFMVLCSRQLGKSFVILCLALMHCAKMFGRRRPLVRIFCQSQKQIDEIVNDNMTLIQALAPPGFIRRTKSERRYQVGFGEIRLAMVSAAHVHGRRGGNATLVITEEGGFSPSESFQMAMQSVVGPQLIRSSGKMIHVTTSSMDDQHYLHDVVQPKCDLAGTLINLTIYHNPQLTDRQIIEAWDLMDDGTGEGWAREYLCEVVRSSTLSVVPEFDEAMLVEELSPPAHAYWLTVLDFGGVRDKHGILFCYYNFAEATLDIAAELLLPINTTTQAIMDQTKAIEASLAEKYGMSFHRRVSDNPGQISVDLAAAGFNVYAPDKPAGSWEANINQVRIGFTRKQLKIHKDCKMLAATLKYGKFNKQRTDFARTAELGHLDLMAALMYAWRHKDTANPEPFLPAGFHPDTHYVDRDALRDHKNRISDALFGKGTL